MWIYLANYDTAFKMVHQKLTECDNVFFLKVHFVIHSPIPPFYLKTVDIFTSAEVFRYIMFVCKIFLANSFAWQSNRSIVYLLCLHNNYQHSGLCNSMITCITHKCNLGIDWKFGNMLILSISTELCHKNNMLGSQNGPLKTLWLVNKWCIKVILINQLVALTGSNKVGWIGYSDENID